MGPLPPHRQVVGCKWVFRVKENADGSINNYKSRMVAKEFHQVHDFDFHETFSPMVKTITIRLFLLLLSPMDGNCFNLISIMPF